jgi:hypothetical protein
MIHQYIHTHGHIHLLRTASLAHTFLQDNNLPQHTHTRTYIHILIHPLTCMPFQQGDNLPKWFFITYTRTHTHIYKHILIPYTAPLAYAFPQSHNDSFMHTHTHTYTCMHIHTFLYHTQLHSRMPFHKAIICPNDTPVVQSEAEHKAWLEHIHACLGKVWLCFLYM